MLRTHGPPRDRGMSEHPSESESEKSKRLSSPRGEGDGVGGQLIARGLACQPLSSNGQTEYDALLI